MPGAGELDRVDPVHVAGPARKMSPPIGVCSPPTTRSIVDLPAPLGPSTATTPPAGQREVDAVQHVDSAVAARGRRAVRAVRQVLMTDSRCALLERGALIRNAERIPLRQRSRCHLLRGAEVAPPGPGIGRTEAVAFGDQLAEVEHEDVRADLHDELHVVLDEQDRHAVGRRARAAARRTPSVSSSSWPDAGSSSSSSRGWMASARAELDEPALAGGQRVGALVGHVGQADPLEQLVAPSAAASAVVPFAPLRRSRAPRGCSRGRSAAEELEPLERAGHPEPGPLVGQRLPMSLPSRLTLPGSASCSPVMTLNIVVLPAPFGPIRPVMRPASADQAHRRRARCGRRSEP